MECQKYVLTKSRAHPSRLKACWRERIKQLSCYIARLATSEKRLQANFEKKYNSKKFNKRISILAAKITTFLYQQRIPLFTSKTILLVFALAVLTACSSKPYVVDPTKTGLATNSEIHEVYVVERGTHTGFVIVASEIKTRLPKLKERFKSTPYLEIGWGDKAFYQSVQQTINIYASAMFWPTDSAVHVVAVTSMTDPFFLTSNRRKLCLNSNEYLSLINFISNSFDKGNNGKIIPLNHGQYRDSQFYKAVGGYSLLNTCNKWTAKGLKSAGIDILPTFKLTAASVMDHLQALQTLQDANAPGSQNPIPDSQCPRLEN